MKKPYEAPNLVRLKTGGMNKFGGKPFYLKRVRKEIGGAKIDDLIEQFGSPLFVYSEAEIIERANKLKSSFSTRYPNVQFGWSYKTNYLSAICAVMHAQGALAEVVSGFEYQKARALGVPAHKIIFNGPFKRIEDLRLAVNEGAMIQIDHLDEVYDLEALAEERGQQISVAIRISMDCGIYPQWSKFGFDLEKGMAEEAVKRIQAGGKLTIRGLHAHIGTYVMEPQAYATQITKMVAFGYRLEQEWGFEIEYYDIGGGFPSSGRLKGVYLPPEVGVPTLDSYAEAICEALLGALQPGHFPKLILETGRAMIDDAGYLITSVTSSKRLPDGRRAYIVDAGVNILYTTYWFRHNLELAQETEGLNEPSVVYGPLCMNLDVLDEACLLPRLERGAKLVLSPVGAYNHTQSMQFIEYRPASVLVTPQGQGELIREREDLSDIQRREGLPDRF